MNELDRVSDETVDDYWVICPYCGEQHGDAWDWVKSEHPEIMECEVCGKEFKYWQQVHVTYWAAPIEEHLNV